MQNEDSYKQIIFQQDPKQNALIKYGEYIYNRESCTNCHSLNINENPNLISLDGLKNKYNDLWHYLHLVDPNSMVYESKMPSYKKLSNTKLNVTTFENNLKLDKNEWNEFIKLSDIHFKNLKKTYIESYELEDNNNDINDRTEIIALIAYLQNIPPSKEFIKRDSIENIKIQNELNNWEELLNNQNSIIYKEITSKESIEKGNAIYNQNCFICHGNLGGGGIGPNLTDDYWLYGSSNLEIAKVIALGGKPNKGMISWNSIIKPDELGQLIAYIKSLKGTNPKNAKIGEGKKE